jgi:hypothetical protein
MHDSENLNNIINPDVEPPAPVDFKKDMAHYRKTLYYMGANVPLQVLCLPKVIEKLLVGQGYVRVYDLISCDLTEIKGLGESRRDLLAARLDQFFTVSI